MSLAATAIALPQANAVIDGSLSLQKNQVDESVTPKNVSVSQQKKDGFHIVINIPERKLTLFYGEQPVKRYDVGVGRAGFPSPLGQYNVIRKVVNPTWENPYRPQGVSQINPGKGNPLGTRWIGFKQDGKGEFGIHGTNAPHSVGKFVSHGCIRMRTYEAEELFRFVDLGASVELVYALAVVEQDNNKLTVSAFPDPYGKGKVTAEQVRRIND